MYNGLEPARHPCCCVTQILSLTTAARLSLIEHLPKMWKNSHQPGFASAGGWSVTPQPSPGQAYQPPLPPNAATNAASSSTAGSSSRPGTVRPVRPGTVRPGTVRPQVADTTQAQPSPTQPAYGSKEVSVLHFPWQLHLCGAKQTTAPVHCSLQRRCVRTFPL